MIKHIAISIIMFGAMSGCGHPERDNREAAEFRAQYDAEMAQTRRDIAVQWDLASDDARLSWLEKCRTEILGRVNKSSSYGGFFVNAYSADVFQMAVLQNGYSVDRADELKLRIAEYHERVSMNASLTGLSAVDTTFVVVRRVPLEGVPNNFHVSQYRCEMGKDFGVKVI